MELQNGYKLLYEFVKENKKSIFATKSLPDFESDLALTFKSGDEEADLEGIKLVYMKDGSIYVSKKNIVTEDDQKVLVYAGDDLLIGVEDEEEEEGKDDLDSGDDLGDKGDDEIEQLEGEDD